MATERIIPGEIRIFLNHIYEFKKGVRNMVLYTMSREHEEFAIRRLKNQKISYMIQEVGTNKINLFFGKPECMEAMRHIIIRPLNQLTAEEDFILGAMLGYDLCQQCKRYCNKKRFSQQQTNNNQYGDTATRTNQSLRTCRYFHSFTTIDSRLDLLLSFLAQTCPRKQAHSGQQRIHRRKIQSFPSQLYWYQTHY